MRKTFQQAVLSRDASAIGPFIEALRMRGATYSQILEIAQKRDPSLDLTTWDALLAEAEEEL